MPELASLAAYLEARILGQAEAVAEFSAAILRAELGPRRPSRTKALLLLLGPTGTGKTEMVKLCARFLYGTDSVRRLKRFDLGEYQHRDSVLRLLGAPGQPALLGQSIDELTAEGGGILLLDEIEKAHPDLLSLLLSFDEARSTMADGRTRDLSSCYVMMTSNLGAAEASQMLHNGYSAIRRKVLHDAEQAFRKETLARFSAAIVMNLLSYEVQERIAAQLLERELLLQSEHCRRWIEVADRSVLGFLVSRGFSPDMGARNLRRTVERYVGDALRPFAPLVAGGPPLEPPGQVGDLWSRGLVLRLEGEALEAWPLRSNGNLRRLLAREALAAAAEEAPFTPPIACHRIPMTTAVLR